MIGRPSTAHVTTEPTPTTSTNEEKIVTISQADYDRLLQLKVTDSVTTVSHSPFIGTSVLLTSRNSSSLILIPPPICRVQKTCLNVCLSFLIFDQLFDIRSVAIVDGRSCPVTGERVVQALSQLSLEKVLYVPDFPVNLLSISAISKKLLCYVTFFPFHCIF